MTVKSIIITALNLMRRRELSSLIDNNSTYDPDGREVIAILLCCYNAVEDELARRYVPLINVETFTVTDGKLPFSHFSKTPAEIKRVTRGGEEIEFSLYDSGIKLESGSVAVEYAYVPDVKNTSDDSSYSEVVGQYVIAAGMLAEFYTINGEVELAKLWESRYRNQLDRLRRKLPVCRDIPPRCWI